MIKIGVIGAGHLGRIHISRIKEIAAFELVGVFDINAEVLKSVSGELSVKAFSSAGELLSMCDAVDIVSPTLSHFEYAKSALIKGKHVFIEKPITQTTNEAAYISDLAQKSACLVQVGHVERFNPAFMSAVPYFDTPLFIETHRLAQFNPRGTDVSVVHDLMIHDIDIVLSVVKSPLKFIYASGVAVVSDTPDIANARIEFENGCVANLTASRISIKNMRKSRFFQSNAYISVDFLKKKTEVIRLKELHGEPDPLSVTIDLGGNKGKKIIYFENPHVEESNAIKKELELFAQSIIQDKPSVVSAHDGLMAVKVANEIFEKINISALTQAN